MAEIKQEPRNHTGIIAAIIISGGVIAGTIFGVSTLFEKPRAFVTATYNPSEQELVYRNEESETIGSYYQMQKAYFDALSREQALQDKIDGKKPAAVSTTTTTTTVNVCAPRCPNHWVYPSYPAN